MVKIYSSVFDPGDKYIELAEPNPGSVGAGMINTVCL